MSIAAKLLYKFLLLITVPCVIVWIVLSSMLSGISPEIRVFQSKDVLPGVNHETSFTTSVTLHTGLVERGKGFPTHITPASISVMEFLREAQLNDSEVSRLSRQFVKFKANTTKPYLLSLSITDQKKLRNSTAARNLQQYKTRVSQEFKNNSIPLADLDLLKKLRPLISGIATYVIAWMLQTRCMAPSLIYKGPFNFLRDFKSPCWYNDHNQLRCLPFFWFIGTAKSGTSDIYRMLRIHPNFESPFKEYDWLARNRLEIDFDSYTKSVALSFEHQRSLKSKYQLTKSKDSYREAILGDCSPSTMTDNFNWPALEENIHPLEPTYTNADYVYHLNKDARIIIILRNPINRLFSDYFFHDETGRRTVDDFHSDVVREVDLFNRCMRQYSVWSCCTNWPLVEDFNARLWIGLYVIYLRDWYRLFPQEHIYTLQFEEYTEHRHDIILKLYEFLTLKDISATSSSAEFDEATKSSERSNPNTKRRKDYEINGMRLDTRYILYNFYKPFNEALAHFLNDRSFDYGPF